MGKTAVLEIICVFIISGFFVFFLYHSDVGEAGNSNYSRNREEVVTFMKTFGGSDYDCGNIVHTTSDDGYIIIGYTESYGAGGSDFWLVKTDKSGNELWNKTFGEDTRDESFSGQQTSDGGYIIVGRSLSLKTDNWNILLIKTDSSGNEEWNKTFGEKESVQGESVYQTSDGGYIILGNRGVSSGSWLIKTDSSGKVEWSRTFSNRGNIVRQTSDMGYIIIGESCLIKTNDQGIKQWEKPIWGHSVQQTSDGGYIIVASTESFGAGKDDVWLIKTDDLGNELWNKTYGGKSWDYGKSVQQTSDGGYSVLGSTISYGAGNRDVWLIKTDDLGNEVWNQTYGGLQIDSSGSVQQTSDNGYIITGTTGSYGGIHMDAWLIKTDSFGKAYQAPFARLTISSEIIEINENITFNASLSYDHEGNVAGYYFDFGDGNNSGWITSSTIEHTYTTAGTFTMKFKVKDEDGYESKENIFEIFVREDKVKDDEIEDSEEKDKEENGNSILFWLVFIIIIIMIILIIFIWLVKRNKKIFEKKDK